LQATTGLVSIFVDAHAAKTMVFAPGANEAFAEADVRRLVLDLHQAPAASMLVVDSEISPSALALALQAARDDGRPTLLDPTRPEHVTDHVLAVSDHVTPNHDEAQRLTGVAVETAADTPRAARQLRERGASAIFAQAHRPTLSDTLTHQPRHPLPPTHKTTIATWIPSRMRRFATLRASARRDLAAAHRATIAATPANGPSIGLPQPEPPASAVGQNAILCCA
jgi:sugar/nucleoside kinase (ribokinase family)